MARLSATQQSLVALGVLVFLLLALTGKLGMLIPLFGAVAAAFIALVSRLIPILAPLFARHLPEWLDRIRDGGTYSRTARGTGQHRSSARTDYLLMSLDHQSGHLDGTVLQGPHEGKKLSELSMKALSDLYSLYLKDDQESAKLLAAFIEQNFGYQWQRGNESPAAQSVPQMTREEALSILGLDPSASQEAIIAAHRRLIQKVHPDRGGSDYLATRINLAKDSLLGK